jgi:hypothetical protein
MIGSTSARRIALGIAALALVAHTGITASAAPARCGAPVGRQPIELCRVTVLKGSSAGYVRVHISGESTVNADAVQVSGKGSFGGFVLTEDLPKFDGTTILGGQASSGGESHEFVCCKFQATPGTYRLYLLTRSPSTKVTLRLDGQPEGITTVSPKVPTSFELAESTPSAAGGTTPEYYGGGATGKITAGHGLTFAGLWVDTSTRLLSQSGRCLYFGDVPADAFAPGCPWPGPDHLWSQSGGVSPSTVPVSSGVYGMTWPVPTGTYSHGAYAATAGLAKEALSIAGFLNFD